MKKLILASTIAALSLTAAQAAPTVYGKAGIGINYTDAGDGDITLDTASTRIGFKGGEQITANTKAVYQLEYNLNTEGDGVNFTQRDTFVGFENAQLGTLKAGHLTTVDDAVDFTNPSEFGGTSASIDEARWKNSLQYTTGNIGGLEVLAQYAVNDSEMTESKDKDGKTTVTSTGEGSFALAGKFASGPVAAGASFVSKDDFAKAIRVSGALDVAPAVKLSALYQITDFDADDSEKENALTVAAEYDVVNTPWDVYAQFDMTDNVGGAEDEEQSIISAGANYAFTEATTGHVYLGVKEAGDDDSFGLGAKVVHAF